jgi:NAD-dependent deacetylase
MESPRLVQNLKPKKTYKKKMNQELFITGAGVSADSGIPTFRGTDGFWTIGSDNYTPQEMATRRMYENDPEEFLLWYFKRFVSLQGSKPNFSHFWLADKLLITQNIDGLDGKAGNKKYIPIHGRLDKLIIYDDQENIQVPFDANWQDIIQNVGRNNLFALRENLLKKCKITKNESKKNYMPQRGISLKPFVLLFDEYYTENYRISEAIKLMETASKIVFIGTSFSVNITSIALETAMANNIPIEIVDPEPVEVAYSNTKYHQLTAIEYCKMRSK